MSMCSLQAWEQITANNRERLLTQTVLCLKCPEGYEEVSDFFVSWNNNNRPPAESCSLVYEDGSEFPVNLYAVVKIFNGQRLKTLTTGMGVVLYVSK